jgi:polyphosphate kinase
VLGPQGDYLRSLTAKDGQLFSCHKFFMENPSLSGRGSAGAKDVPKLAHSRDESSA